MATPPNSIPASRAPGRLFAVLGLALIFLGPILYVMQVALARVLTVPWYMLFTAAAGMGLLLYALVQARTGWRIAGLIVGGLLTAAQVLVLFGETLAPYNGPAQAGQPMPEFSSTLADGKPFTTEQLKGNQDNALVFFRGRW
jgi:hypothetical protein